MRRTRKPATPALFRAAVLAIALLPGLFAGPAADLAQAIREESFDRAECYRVRDLRLAKEDITIYLTDGHLIFAKPVAGRRIAAVFVADTDGGDAEVILMPPDRAERRSLAAYIHSPNLDEHVRSAVLLFTGDDYNSLMAQMAENPANRKTPEIGALLDEAYTPMLRELCASYQARVVFDLVNQTARKPNLFAAFVSSPKLGGFDLIYDPAVREQVVAGQITTRDKRMYFDTWTSFAARSTRKQPTLLRHELSVSNYRIEATVAADLTLSVVTRMKVETNVDGLRAIAFDLTPLMEVTGATLDGKPIELLQRESLRRPGRGANQMFLLVSAEPLHTGQVHELEVHHTGKVIADAGDRVLYVGARGNWYPLHGAQFATYDLTFRYPSDLDLVAPGDLVDERTEGEWRITHRRTASTIRLAGFNMGNYARQRVERGGYVVEVCANRTLESSLRPQVPDLSQLPGPARGLQRRTNGPTVMPDFAPDPLERLHKLATDVSSAMEFMASKFGPPALPHLTISPIPGGFGQGFPGLIYLSTLSYLNKLPSATESRTSHTESPDVFFQDLLQVHETAHQWWGNRVDSAGYHDNWLMEALANYSALLYLEKSRGPHLMGIVLESYRNTLLGKGSNGETLESAGAIVLGTRLESSLEPASWRAITYGKGTWIMQMLRRRMGDQRFFAMLAELAKRYDHQEVSTEQFRLLAASFMPPKSQDSKLETFFDQWVYGTGIPTLKMTYTVKGHAPSVVVTGTVTQSGVDDDFATLVPVEIQVARGRSITEWVPCSNEPATFRVPLQAAPLKVALDPNYAVLRKP
jgi:hypothetical protein